MTGILGGVDSSLMLTGDGLRRGDSIALVAGPTGPVASAELELSAPGASAKALDAYVEQIDPDGDGDAHFVLASEDSVTAPGLAVIDVERGLRPQPLPGPGDRVSAAGPVYRGSYGQRQIQADELHVAG
jgi:hypothetical protein